MTHILETHLEASDPPLPGLTAYMVFSAYLWTSAFPVFVNGGPSPESSAIILLITHAQACEPLMLSRSFMLSPCSSPTDLYCFYAEN